MDWPRVIETERMRLRDLRPGDAESVHASYACDPDVARYLAWPMPASVYETRQHINYDIHRWLKGSAWVWGLTMKAPHEHADRVFGQIELIPQSFPSDDAHHLRLGYLMSRAQWGQGLMSEALKAVLDVALAQPGVWRVDALCDVDNQASVALLERLGMCREGLMSRALMHPHISSVPRDVYVFAIAKRHSNSVR